MINFVLILVVVEDGLVLNCLVFYGINPFSLNPCCSGQWSRTEHTLIPHWLTLSLNPYCSGQWSRTFLAQLIHKEINNLNPCCNGRWSRTLVVSITSSVVTSCLNPCCNGRWSLTLLKI